MKIIQFSKSVLKECYHESMTEFDEKRDCEVCDRKDIPCKLMYGVECGDRMESRRIGEEWTCFECYKEKMKPHQETEKQLMCMFRPEWANNPTTKTYLKTDSEGNVIEEYKYGDDKNAELV